MGLAVLRGFHWQGFFFFDAGEVEALHLADDGGADGGVVGARRFFSRSLLDLLRGGASGGASCAWVLIWLCIFILYVTG